MVKKRGCVKKRRNGCEKVLSADVDTKKRSSRDVKKHPVYDSSKKNLKKKKAKSKDEVQVEKFCVVNAKLGSSKRDNVNHLVKNHGNVLSIGSSCSDWNAERSGLILSEMKTVLKPQQFVKLTDIPIPETWEMLLDMDVFKMELTCSSEVEQSEKPSPKGQSLELTNKEMLTSLVSGENTILLEQELLQSMPPLFPIEMPQESALPPLDKWPLESWSEFSDSCRDSSVHFQLRASEHLLKDMLEEQQPSLLALSSEESSLSLHLQSSLHSGNSCNTVEIIQSKLAEPISDRSGAKHSLHAFRKPRYKSDMLKLMRYKTEMCRFYEEGFLCRYGMRCRFAHGFEELRNLQRHPKYKTELCRNFHLIGYCHYGRRCAFIHNTARHRRTQIDDYDDQNGKDPTNYQNHGNMCVEYVDSVSCGRTSSMALSSSPECWEDILPLQSQAEVYRSQLEQPLDQWESHSQIGLPRQYQSTQLHISFGLFDEPQEQGNLLELNRPMEHSVLTEHYLLRASLVQSLYEPQLQSNSSQQHQLLSYEPIDQFTGLSTANWNPHFQLTYENMMQVLGLYFPFTDNVHSIWQE